MSSENALAVKNLKRAPATAFNLAVPVPFVHNILLSLIYVFTVFYMLELEFSPVDEGCQYIVETVPFNYMLKIYLRVV